MAHYKPPAAGLAALDECENQVRVTIRNYLDEISKFLKDCEIIDLDLYKAVTDPDSRETKKNRAHRVFLRLKDIVEGDEQKYVIFRDYLIKDSKFSNTVSMLGDAYEKYSVQPQACDQVPPQPPGLFIHSVIKLPMVRPNCV